MKTVELQYYVIFGKGDSSDCIPWEVDLTDEEEEIYDRAVEEGEPVFLHRNGGQVGQQ